MKKLILEIAVMATGALGAIAILVSTVLSPLQPWIYNGISGWYGCLLGIELAAPFAVSLAAVAAGLAVAVRDAFDPRD
ncbi:hypothetical protein [uncultured Oscillibacter sp.]|uniref:hypothetical protein n=1 Tax=uncultured Oscillibacter sp. TaxID=876091 RepID=UPI0026014B6B|nr:hypothetical protein [uncultured Oscillibacter sp.]